MHQLLQQRIIRPFNGPIEVFISIVIIAILASIALANYRVSMQRAELIDAISQFPVIRTEVMARYVLLGRWPEDIGFPSDMYRADAIPKRISSLSLQRGGFTMQLGSDWGSINGRHLSFRMAYHPEEPLAPVRWLCGYANAPAGYHVAAPNKTDIAPEFLPDDCLEGK